MFLEASQHLQVQEVTVMLLEAAEIREHHLPFKHLFVTSLQRMKRDLVSLRMTDLRLELPSEPTSFSNFDRPNPTFKHKRFIKLLHNSIFQSFCLYQQVE